MRDLNCGQMLRGSLHAGFRRYSGFEMFREEECNHVLRDVMGTGLPVKKMVAMYIVYTLKLIINQ